MRLLEGLQVEYIQFRGVWLNVDDSDAEQDADGEGEVLRLLA